MTQPLRRDPRLVEVPVALISFVAEIVNETGLVAASKRLKMSKTSVLGVLGTGKLMPGTLALLTAAHSQRSA